MVEHFTAFVERPTVVPAVNEIERHAHFAQRTVRDLVSQHPHPGMVTDRRHHLLHRRGNHTSTLDAPTIAATFHAKTPARGHALLGASTRAVGDPEVQAQPHSRVRLRVVCREVTTIDSLDSGRRGGRAPEVITLEAFGRDIPEA